MHSFGKTAIATTALLALVQFSSAAFLGLEEATVAGIDTVAGVVSAASGVAGNVESGVSANKSDRKRAGRFQREVIKRQDANQQAWNDCHTQLGSAHVTFSAPSTGNVLVRGVPPACMTLVTVITGQHDEGNPVPQGTDSVLFQNLSDGDIKAIQDALNAHPSNQK